MQTIDLTQEQYNKLLSKLTEITNTLSKKAPPETFIDNADFIRLMKISKRTAQSWRDEGKIPFAQIGNKIYYLLADVEALLKQHYNKQKVYTALSSQERSRG